MHNRKRSLRPGGFRVKLNTIEHISSVRWFLRVQNNNNNNNNMNDSDIYIGPIYVDLFINVES